MPFSLHDIESALSAIDISYQTYGPPSIYNEFCSFRLIRNNGIYFCAGGIKPPEDITASLFICDQLRPDLVEKGNTTIVLEDAQTCYYKLLNKFFPRKISPGLHPTAIIDPDAVIEDHVEIGPYCIIGKANIKSGVYLQSNVTINDKSIIGKHVTIEPYTVIGATGVAWAYDQKNGERIMQPQIGGVVIGDHSFIGSNVTVVRGSVNENTEIGLDCMIAHGTKIGHGCRIGEHTHFANNVSIAGNVDIGAYSFLGSGSVVRPNIVLGEGTIVAAGAVVVKSILEPDRLLMGVPATASRYNNQSLSGIPQSFRKKRGEKDGQ
jgi:UDP-3-O-[3-hydroxymyristoyl] glucosamine N-acyltransferase